MIKIIKQSIWAFLFLITPLVHAAAPDSLQRHETDSNVMKPRHLPSIVQNIGLNIGVWAINRYISNEGFARIGFQSIKHNFETGFVWDNDKFSTNLFAHPYHGSLYYNIARANGMNFAWSSVYAFGGSAWWELFMENEPPSLNDLLATTVGGIALGEITWRLSDKLIKDEARGWNRFWHEAAVTAVSPMRGFNRLIRGEMWLVKPIRDAYEADPADERLITRLTLGDTYMAADGRLFTGTNNLFARLRLTYGDPFKYTYKNPYDYFELDVEARFPKPATLGNISAIGLIWGKNDEPVKGHRMLRGIFQHFDYITFDSVQKIKPGVPVEMAGAAVVGGGMIYSFPTSNKNVRLTTSAFANIVLLGGSTSDYYSVIDRNYNLGSGFSAKLQSRLEADGVLAFALNYHLLRVYSWVNQIGEEYYRTGDLHYLDVQGAIGNTQMQMIEAAFDINLTKSWILELSGQLYKRDSYYKASEFTGNEEKRVHFTTIRTMVGFTWKL